MRGVDGGEFLSFVEGSGTLNDSNVYFSRVTRLIWFNMI